MSEIKLPKGWVLLVEESKSLPKGILKLKTDKEKILYVKASLDPNTMFEVLTSEELKELGIAVEESYSHSEEKPYVVEESESSEEKSDVWNPQKESLEEYKKRMSGKQAHIDVNAVELLRGELEQERLNREDLEAKLLIVAEKEFKRKKEELGCTDESIDSPDKLKGWAIAHKTGKSEDELRAERKADPIGKGAGGQAKLSQAKGTKSGEYDSYEQMIDDLRIKSKSSDPEIVKENQALLVELFKRSIKGRIESDKPFKYEDTSQIPLKEQLPSHKEFLEWKKRLLEQKGEKHEQ